MSNGRIVIPGGSGFLGKHLVRFFTDQGRDVVILSRHSGSANGGSRYVHWDGATLGEWARELDGAAALVNLAGRSVNCRYHKRNRLEILESRLKSTVVLGQAIKQCASPPPVWINAGSATIYRDARDRPMDEHTGELGSGFSVDVCRQWEAALLAADVPHTRRIALRTALVLGANDGVMEAFQRIVRLGLGGTLGQGDQMVSWVHVQDFLRTVDWLLQHDLDGPVNCAAPQPLTNREFMSALRVAYGQPIGLPAAAWMLEIGAFVLQTETELLLKSRWVLSTRLQKCGFRFDYPKLDLALEQIVNALTP